MAENKFSREYVGIRIKEIRGKLTYKQFAELLGVSAGFVNEIEKGVKKPSAEMLYAIANKYSININWLLTGEGGKLPKNEHKIILTERVGMPGPDAQLKDHSGGADKMIVSQPSIYNKVVKQVDGMVGLNYEVKQLIMQLCRVYYLSDDIGRAKLGMLLAALDPGDNK